MKILIVDDEPLILKSLDYTFKKIGCETIAAIDGMQAKELYQKHNPDFVIIDIMLPFVSGLELIEYIRDTESTHTMLIVLSSIKKQNTIEHCFNMGIDDYIRKPFMPVELLSRIERLKKYRLKTQFVSTIN